MTDRARGSELHEITWVHVFEQDTPAGSVFLRDEADIPLSRRPRLRLVLHADGSAEVAQAGADDRPIAHAAYWREEHGSVVVRTADGKPMLHVLEHSNDRLLVQLKQA